MILMHRFLSQCPEVAVGSVGGVRVTVWGCDIDAPVPLSVS